MVNVPKSTGGPGPSRSIVLLLAAGVLSLVTGGLEYVGLVDFPWLEDPAGAMRYGYGSLAAAFAVRRVGGRP